MARDTEPGSGLERPDPPPATRLNKLAVIVAAGVMSVTLLVVTLLVSRRSDRDAQEKAEREEASRLPRGPARPGFLDRPPELLPEEDTAGEVPLYEETPVDTGTIPEDDFMGGSEETPTVPDLPPDLYGTEDYYASPAYAEDTEPPATPDEQALERALRASLVPQGFGARATLRGQASGNEESDDEEDDFLSALEAMQQAFGAGDESLPVDETPPVGYEPSGAGSGGSVAPSGQDPEILATVQPAGSPYRVREGTLIEAFLITGIHSDLPGEVMAQVARNVFDSETQQVLLIPKGTRLIGTYDNQVALDQSRLLVAWNRMLFPDGRSVSLPGLSSTDTKGATGLSGRVNRHYGRAFGNALMLSVVGAGLSLAQRRPDTGELGGVRYPTPGEILSGSIATELSRVATEILRSNINRRPTITIEEGAAFNVFMNGDLPLPPYRSTDRRIEW